MAYHNKPLSTLVKVFSLQKNFAWKTIEGLIFQAVDQ